MGKVESVSEFTTLCNETSERWKNLAAHQPGKLSPAELVSRYWSDANAQQGTRAHRNMDRLNGILMSGGAAGFAIGAIVLATGPIGLVGAAGAAIMSAGFASAGRRLFTRQNAHQIDHETTENDMRTVRNDLGALLEQAHGVAKTLHRGGNRQGIIQIEDQLTAFLEDELGLNSSELRHTKTGNFDKADFKDRTAAKMASDTIKKIERLRENVTRPDGGTGAGRDVGREPQRPDPARNQGLDR